MKRAPRKRSTSATRTRRAPRTKKIQPQTNPFVVSLVSVVCVIVLGLFVVRIAFPDTIARLALDWGMPRVAAHFVSSDTELLMNIADTFFSPEQYDLPKARQMYQRVLTLNPQYPGANYQLGRTYFIVGDHALALMYLSEEERLRPTFGKVHYMKGLVYGYMKDFPSAEKEFLEFIAFDSFNWAGYNDLAWIYFAQGYYFDAEGTAREGLIHAADNPWLHNAVGVSLLAQKRGADAIEHFEKAKEGFIRMSPDTWGIAYPGNSPYEHAKGLEASLGAVERNLERARALSVENPRRQTEE